MSLEKASSSLKTNKCIIGKSFRRLPVINSKVMESAKVCLILPRYGVDIPRTVAHLPVTTARQIPHSQPGERRVLPE
jgi:hypothetical protein